MTIDQFEEGACDHFLRQLDCQTYDSLPAETNQKLLYHLKHCSACVAVWDARSRIQTRLKATVERQEVPAALWVKIRERLNE
jgi:hypothetical protein